MERDRGRGHVFLAKENLNAVGGQDFGDGAGEIFGKEAGVVTHDHLAVVKFSERR